MRKKTDETLSGRRFFTGTDIIIILLALFAAFALRPAKGESGGDFCRVTVNGETVKTVRLSDAGDFTVPGAGGMVFRVRDGAVGVACSDCPDKTCVRSGFIKSPGQKIACVPNKTVVDVGAGGHGGPDMIAG